MALDQTIADWTQADLRRFIRGQIQNDPLGMVPSSATVIPDQVLQIVQTIASPAKLDYGVATCVFAAAVFSAVLTVDHGLGKTPVVVVATGDTAGASAPVVDVQNFTETTFQVRCGDSQGVARTGNQNVFWIAVG